MWVYSRPYFSDFIWGKTFLSKTIQERMKGDNFQILDADFPENLQFPSGKGTAGLKQCYSIDYNTVYTAGSLGQFRKKKNNKVQKILKCEYVCRSIILYMSRLAGSSALVCKEGNQQWETNFDSVYPRGSSRIIEMSKGERNSFARS